MENQEEKGSKTAEPVVLELPSSSEYILLARLVVSCAGQLAGFEPEDVYDLKLAVTEAATNVDEHGGFGLAVIQSLIDEVVVDSTASGTRLKMIRRGTPPE
jgi:serine/threonine-protein kinase RsbW